MTKSMSRKNQNKNKRSKKSLSKQILLYGSLLFITFLVVGALIFAYFASTAPAFSMEKLKDPVPSRVFDQNDELVTTIYQGVEREYINIEDTPEIVTDAVLAVEDNRFYEHGAIDFKRLASAVVSNVTKGFGSQGASTITQQVVKRAFLTEEKTIKRKAQEAYLSYRLEQEYSKDDILEMYLNKIYYSDGIYGVRTASIYYFDKELEDLNLKEAAYLAGLPNLPNVYNLYIDKEAGNYRANRVLELMLHHGRITEAEYNEAANIDLEDNLVSRTEEERASDKPNDPEYASYINMVKQQLAQSDELRNTDVSELLASGIDIYTNMDKDAQEYLQGVVDNRDYFYNDKFKSDDFNIASTIIDTETGALRAISGGRDYREVLKENFAITQHNVGSTMKPILAYGPAIENLDWRTDQTIKDEKEYTPKEFSANIYNYDNQNHGTVTIRESLRRSFNIPAVKTFEEVQEEAGKNAPEKFAEGLGLDYSKKQDGNYTLTFNDVLGGYESRFSPLQMAQAYAAFGNGGTFNEAGSVRYIIDSEDERIDFDYESHQAMDDSTAFMITDMLKGTFEPWGSADYIKIPGLNIAGKTGTTSYSNETVDEYNLPDNSAKDAWIIGYTPEYTVSIWTGFTQTKKDGETSFVGSDEHITPQWLFRDIMTKISSFNGQDFEMPNSVERVNGNELAKKGQYEIFNLGQGNVNTQTNTWNTQNSQNNQYNQNQNQNQNNSNNNSNTNNNDETEKSEENTESESNNNSGSTNTEDNSTDTEATEEEEPETETDNSNNSGTENNGGSSTDNSSDESNTDNSGSDSESNSGE